MPDKLEQVLTERHKAKEPTKEELQVAELWERSMRLGHPKGDYYYGGEDEKPVFVRNPPSGKQPFVMGRPEVAKRFWEISNLNPRVKDLVNSVTVGPNAGTMSLLEGSGFSIYDYPKLNILGHTDLDTGDISINPRGTDRDKLNKIIPHELTHLVGHGYETVPMVSEQQFPGPPIHGKQEPPLGVLKMLLSTEGPKEFRTVLDLINSAPLAKGK